MKRNTHIYSDPVIALSPDKKFTNEDAFKYKMLSHYIKNVETFRQIVLNKTLCFSSLHKLKDKSEENAVSRRNSLYAFLQSQLELLKNKIKLIYNYSKNLCVNL